MTPDELLAQIAEEEARLTALDHQRDGGRAPFARNLREQLAAMAYELTALIGDSTCEACD